MLPRLRFLRDQQEHLLRKAVAHVAAEFQLSDAERRQLLPSGNQKVIQNRVGWARTYLAKAGLIDATRRGYFKIMLAMR